MTNQLRLFVLIVLLPLAACTNSYRMEKAGGTVTSTTPLLAHGEKVLVMLPADGEYGAIKYAGSGTSTQRAIVAALSAAGADALTGKAIGDRSAAIAAAKQANAKWLVIPRIQGWEDRATEWSGLPDRRKLEITIVLVQTEQLSDSTVVSGASKWATFGGEHPQDMLTPALTPWANSIVKK